MPMRLKRWGVFQHGGGGSSVPALSITTASPLTAGQSGVPYTGLIAGAGGVGPYAFTVSAGALPGGLTLSPSGFLSGTPTAVNTTVSGFTVLLTDALLSTVSKVFAMTVTAGTAIFSDNFNRANTARGIGDNYVLQTETAAGNEVSSADPFPAINGNTLLWSNAAAAGVQSPGARLTPRAVFGIYGLAQYAQIVWVSTNNPAQNDFLYVMAHGSVKGRDFQGYFWGQSAAGITTLFLVWIDAAGAVQSSTLGTAAFVAGDTCRVEVVPGGASNHVAVMINGVKQIDVVDNNANRPQGVGLPALAGWSMLVGIILKLDSFECGMGCSFI